MDPSTWAKLALGLLEWLRLRPRKPKVQVPATPPPPTAILLVEDEADDAFLALRVIQNAKHPCDWVQSGEHALILKSKTTYRMMIIDIGLRSGMNGYSLAKAIRKEHPLMPIWLWTGTQDNLFCMEPGFPVGVLLKSARPEALLDAIRMTA